MRTIRLAAALAALTSLTLAAPALAGQSLYAGGLHIAEGALVDPNGRIWVSDHNAGFCRVGGPDADGPGRIEHPETPDGSGPRTCLGGLLPDAQPGPDAAGPPLLLDPSPEFPGSGDEVALIPDGSAHSAEIVRANWNPDTGLFEFKDTFSLQGFRARPKQIAIGPDGYLYTAQQNGAAIQRFKDPLAETPVSEIVGRTSDNEGAGAIAAGRDAFGVVLFVSEKLNGLRELRPQPTPDGQVPPSTEPGRFEVPIPPGDEPAPFAPIGRLLYDLDRDHLYVATATADGPGTGGIDEVHRYHPMSPGTPPEQGFAGGFTGINGLAQRPDGRLLVLDDSAALDPAEPLGFGRMWLLNVPSARVAEPAPAFVPNGEPSFEISGDGELQCVLRRAGEDLPGESDWQTCSSPYQASGLDAGEWILSVRAAAGAGPRIPAVHRFTVDTRAPEGARVVRPAGDAPQPLSPWFEFAADEPHLTWNCKLDGAEEFTSCVPGRTFSFTEGGTHTLQVQPVDRAGNAGEPSPEATFTVDPAVEPQSTPPIYPPRSQHTGRVPYAGGLHVPAGGIIDPNGRVWVADHNGGFCRVTDPDEDGAGRIDHPQSPDAPGPRTCLGGLLPHAGTGPDAAGQPALADPTPDRPGNGDEVVYIPDGSTKSNQLVRADWNPHTGLFEYRDTVSTPEEKPRPTVAATGPDGAVYAATKEEDFIVRFSNPGSPNPTMEVVGHTSDGAGPIGLTVGGTAENPVVYLGQELGTVTRLAPAPATPTSPAPTAEDTGFTVPDLVQYGAIGYDAGADALLVLTGSEIPTPVEQDRLYRFDIASGERQLLQEGLSGGLGLIVRPDGRALVMDDPAVLDAAEPLGTGRIFLTGVPAAHVSGPAFTNDPAQAFQLSGDPEYQCVLRAADAPRPAEADWASCGEGDQFVLPAGLEDGRYVLTVRSLDGGVPSLPEAHRFTLDRRDPEGAQVLRPQGLSNPASPWFDFEADEDHLSWLCRFDGETEFTPCVEGRTRRFESDGMHSLQVQAVDRAGNVSAPSATATFFADGTVPVVTISSPAEDRRQRETDASFTWSASEGGVQYGCRIDHHRFEICGTERSYSGLSEGEHVFEVRARDANGNVSAVAKRRVTVDRTGPATQISGVPEGGETTSREVTFTFSAPDATAYRCSLDGGEEQPCDEGTATYSGLELGEHVFRVVAVDDLGNEAGAERRFRVVEELSPPPPPPPPAPPVTDGDDQGQPAEQRRRRRGRDQGVEVPGEVTLPRARNTGIFITITTPEGTKEARLRLFKTRQNRRGNPGARADEVVAAAAGPRIKVASLKVRLRGGTVRDGMRTVRIRMPARMRRVIRTGSYELHMLPLRDGQPAGEASRAAFTVRQVDRAVRLPARMRLREARGGRVPMQVLAPARARRVQLRLYPRTSAGPGRKVASVPLQVRGGTVRNGVRTIQIRMPARIARRLRVGSWELRMAVLDGPRASGPAVADRFSVTR